MQAGDNAVEIKNEKNMKEVLMGILGVIAYLLIPAIFGGVGAGVYLGILKPPIEAKKILKNGVETTATVIGIDSKGAVTTRSGNTSTTRRYYYLILSFVNSGGDKIVYKTRSIYPESFVRNNNIEKGETVQVMYVGAKAVVKGLVPEKADTFLWVFPIIFGAIAAAFLIVLAVSLVWTAHDSIIKTFGATATGTYLEQKKLIPDLNSITCTFKKENGEVINIKTNFMYTDSVSEDMAKKGSFPIKYLGKKAVIIIDKNKK